MTPATASTVPSGSVCTHDLSQTGPDPAPPRRILLLAAVQATVLLGVLLLPAPAAPAGPPVRAATAATTTGQVALAPRSSESAAPRAASRGERPAAPPGPSPTRPSAATLSAAITQLPGDAGSSVRWVNRAYRGHLGATDWYDDIIYIAPRTPRRLLYSVVAHEWSHVVQVRAYGGSVQRAVSGLNRSFGGSGHVGAERAADCMALLLGATWTNYTTCRDSSWRAQARQLLRDGA